MKVHERVIQDGITSGIRVRVTTNVPQGGDAGHGGITSVFLYGERGDDVPIVVYGDAEARLLARALTMAGVLLTELIEGVA